MMTLDHEYTMFARTVATPDRGAGIFVYDMTLSEDNPTGERLVEVFLMPAGYDHRRIFDFLPYAQLDDARWLATSDGYRTFVRAIDWQEALNLTEWADLYNQQ